MRDWEASDPLFIESGDGIMLRGADGREYYDGNSSMWLNVHGHRRPEIDAAVREQLDKIAQVTLLGLTHEPAARLAEKLVAVAPQSEAGPRLSRVFYSDNGSTAVEVALKMAYQYWRHRGEDRPRFVALHDGYHGDTIGAVSVGGVSLFHGIFKPLLFTADFVPSPAHARDADEAAAQLEDVFRRHAGQIGAFVLEPIVQMAGGILVQPPGYLKRVRELCDRYDVLLIFDEVATGFGRTGTLFACEQEGVTPDFLCLAKGLTGGYLPLAATLTHDRIYDAFLGDYAEWKTFTHGHSYGGNPLACAAAIATLEIFEKDATLVALPPKIALIRRLLDEMLSLPHVADVRQAGMAAGIALVKDKAARTPYPLEEAIGPRVCARARELGLITRPLGPVITFLPPLVSTEEQITAMLGIIRQAISDLPPR
jgi:adenosylmethionine-8-amino-7-oxononanoate aminotransferase